jgi:hypothetical protein
MKQPNDAAKATFEDLFSRLLSTVAEEHDIKSSGVPLTRRVDVRERLHSLRYRLAEVRTRLVDGTAPLLHDHQPPRYAI